MKPIVLSTNLHCESCVKKLAAVLDAHPAVQHWEADVSAPGKPVSLHGSLTRAEAEGLIRLAGFVPGATAANTHCPMPQREQQSSGSRFWHNRQVWGRAAFNTLNCLIGCTIGDFAMVIYLQTRHPGTAMWLQMLLATLAGLVTSVALETALMHYREKFGWTKALRMAVSMSFLSMVAMEVAMNATDFMITGGKAQVGSAVYWLAFIPAALAGFLTPLPYNYYQLKKHNRACH